MPKFTFLLMLALMPLSSYGQEKSIKDCSVLDDEGNVVKCKDGSIYKLILKQEPMIAEGTKVVLPTKIQNLKQAPKFTLAGCALKNDNLEITCSDTRLYALMTPVSLSIVPEAQVRDNTYVPTPPVPVSNSRKAKQSNRGVAGFKDDAFDGKAKQD